jgi:hypothetical protein
MSGEKWSDLNDQRITPRPEPPKPDASRKHFFYVAWQDDSGRIIDIKHFDDYDTALLKGMENAKASGTTYTIRDLAGRFVDGNYVSK